MTHLFGPSGTIPDPGWDEIRAGRPFTTTPNIEGTKKKLEAEQRLASARNGQAN